MIKMLQQRMEEMQQRYEGELAAFRAENATRTAKEKALRAIRPFRRNKQNWTLCLLTLVRPPARGLDKVGQGMSQRKTLLREHHTMKAEHTIGMLPFVPTIMEVHILEQFAPPNFKIYDGSTDQEDHIKMFTNRMVFHTSNDAIWCRAFSLSLEREALEWFNSLPPNSIENFASIKRMFGH